MKLSEKEKKVMIENGVNPDGYNGQSYCDADDVNLLSEIALTVYHDDGDGYLFVLENGVLQTDASWTEWHYEGDPVEVLRGFSTDNFETGWYGLLESYGIKPEITEAESRDTNVKVFIRKHFYKQNNRINSFHKNEKYETVIFPTYQDAEKWIDEKRKAVYQLAYNEIETPEYFIVN